MKLNTGKVAILVEFDNGDKENIYFNPNDPDLMLRMNGVRNRIDDKIKNLADIELTSEGLPKERSNIEAFEKMQNIVKEELDYAFGGEISSVVFKYCSPFAIVNGSYFVIQFMEAIAPEIEEHIKKATAEAEKKMAKHIDKYKK